jgi:hypothetical protein
MRTPGGTLQTGWRYAKIIFVMAENTKKTSLNNNTKQSYEVLIYKEGLM